MNIDDGMFLLIFGGVLLSGLHIWSALKERAQLLEKEARDLAGFQRAQRAQQRPRPTQPNVAAGRPAGSSGLSRKPRLPGKDRTHALRICRSHR